ncbi:MAG: sigma-54-dependent Fis family transcriptional regulator [Deltaproteobacteria bacterium]|nr:sigma-54-dependent Fis family transcriptional regulator [Deltaproteobacteria bacterium]
MPGTLSTESNVALPWEHQTRRETRRVPHLVLSWSVDEPDRIGESVAVDGPICLGRGGPLSDDPARRATLARVRPAARVPCAPIANARISRTHLVAQPEGEGVKLRSVGRAPMRINGVTVIEGVAQDGDVVEIHNAAVFYVCLRPTELASLATWDEERTGDFPFGRPDPFGLVGESEAAWALRDAYAFAASTDRHVLLLGESGVGKEVAARSIHGLSSRSDRSFIARNASTMPETLLDAELFGNAKNYPNPGMPERAGLIGEADGSTLFLDEIGDLPERCQVHLLRVLDADGEYQRLGESKTRRSSFKLVAATNRPVSSLKHDFLARFVHRVEIPGLERRREDVALLVQHLLDSVARKNPAVASRFFEVRASVRAEPRIAPDLVARLLRHPFTHHVRELDRILWLAIGTAAHDFIGLTAAVESELRDSAVSDADVTDLDRETIARALADNDRSPTKTAKALGLKNRYVLIRLLKKYGLSVRPEGRDEEES